MPEGVDPPSDSITVAWSDTDCPKTADVGVAGKRGRGRRQLGQHDGIVVRTPDIADDKRRARDHDG